MVFGKVEMQVVRGGNGITGKRPGDNYDQALALGMLQQVLLCALAVIKYKNSGVKKHNPQKGFDGFNPER